MSTDGRSVGNTPINQLNKIKPRDRAGHVRLARRKPIACIANGLPPTPAPIRWSERRRTSPANW
jgi:hypothetical protein